MLNALWHAPIRKTEKAFRILLNACVYEASSISDNAIIKLNEIERITAIAWSNLRTFNGKESAPVQQTTVRGIFFF